MKLLVIGSTGRTGRHILDQGIRRGYEISAFSRRPQELANVMGLKQIIHGDALNLDDLRKAITGQDAVIAAGGGSALAYNVILTMRELGVRRFVMTSSRSIPATKPAWAVALAWLFLRQAYVDLARAEGMIEMSDLDWTIVRGTMLTDKPFTGKVHTDFEANPTGGSMTLTRADYAMTLLNVLEDPQMVKKAVGVNGAK
jgi:putative NADH-flavin reductase